MSEKKKLTKKNVSVKSKKVETFKSSPDLNTKSTHQTSQKSVISKPKLFFWQRLNTDQYVKLSLAILSLALIVGVFSFNFYILPTKILSQTDTEQAKKREQDAKDAKNKETQTNQARLDQEGKILNFSQNTKWEVLVEFNNFDPITIYLESSWAPKSVENFIRLIYRDYYEGTPIHRIVNNPGGQFFVIQGGDKELKNGQGGRSSFYLNSDQKGEIPDELWEVAPQFGEGDQAGKLINEPKFRDPNLYANFNKETGEVEYRKGLILMAKTSQPNSATSQYFITLDKTILPAQYTVFGVISDDSLKVLDTIRNTIKPISQTPTSDGSPTSDGKPDRDLFVEKTDIISPKVQ